MTTDFGDQLLATTLILTFCACNAKVSFPPDLLPDNVIPTEYHLTIVPYMEHSSPFYDCSLVINLLCQKPTRIVKFHSGANLGLTRDKFSLRSLGSAERLDQHLSYDPDTQQFTIFTSRSIRVGERVSIVVESFRANYSKSALGFYRYPLKDRIDLAVTQFQDNEARRVFPCFDEPRFRAVFHIVMFRKEQLNIQTRSNAPLKETIQFYPGWLADIYEKTLPMPTYTIAFAAFRRAKYRVYERKVRMRGREVKFSLIQNPEESLAAENRSSCDNCHCEISQMIDVTVKFMRFMETYLDVPYPMSKYDLLISRRAQYAGMENMGLVIMTTTMSCSEYVYGHEAIHQWLGNIVTPYWWGDLWLSEGITTFYEHLIFEVMFPEHSRMTEMTIKKSTYTAMRDDRKLNGTMPSITHERNRDLTTAMPIVYYKSATMMRMVFSIVGEKIMQASLKKYFQLYRYSNVTHENLIDVIEQFWNPSPINIRSFMEKWLHEPGYPIVKFTRVDGRIIAQQHDNLNQSRIWPIPLIWSLDCRAIHGRISSFTRMQYLMTKEIEVLPVTVKDTDCFMSNQLLQFYYLPVFDNRTSQLLFDMFDKLVSTVEQKWQQVNESVYVPFHERKELFKDLDSFYYLDNYLSLCTFTDAKFDMITEFGERVTNRLKTSSRLVSKMNRVLGREDVRRKKQQRRRQRRKRRRRRKRRGKKKRFGFTRSQHGFRRKI